MWLAYERMRKTYHEDFCFSAIVNKNETPAAVINVVKFRILISDVSYASQQPFSKVF